jgi:hypothetical protein
MGVLPIPPRLGDLSKLGISVQSTGGESGFATAERGSSLVGRLGHGLGRAGKVGPDVIDLAVALGDGDVMEPASERPRLRGSHGE